MKRGVMGQDFTFGECLIELFRVCGFTPEQVAARAELSETVMADLVTGKQILTGDVAFALADALELSPLILLELQQKRCLETGARASEPAVAV